MSDELDLDAIRARYVGATTAIAQFEAAARDVPALVAEVERLRATVERLSGAVGGLMWDSRRRDAGLLP